MNILVVGKAFILKHILVDYGVIMDYTTIEIIELLEKLVSYPTVNDPLRGMKPSKNIVDFIVDWMNKYNVPIEVYESNGYYSVFGAIGDKPKVMLLAHFDVVPATTERWSYNPFKLTIIDNKAYGRGALDDKSNVAAMMLALRELVRNGNTGFAYAFTGDEEIGGLNGAGYIAKKLASENNIPRYLVNGDGMGMYIITRRRKAFNVTLSIRENKIRVKGFTRIIKFTSNYPISQHAHAAYFIPGLDTHPLIAVSTFLRENKYYVKSIKGEFLKSNVIPPVVELEYVELDPNGPEIEVDIGLTMFLKTLLNFTRMPIKTRSYSDYGVTITPNVYQYRDGKHTITLDIRAMALEKDVEESITDTIMNNPDLVDIEWKVSTDPGMYLNTPINSKLVNVFKETLRELGYEAKIIEGAGASDSRYFTPLGVEAVDFGPEGGSVHGDDEYVNIESLSKLPTIYYKLVKKLASTQL